MNFDIIIITYNREELLQNCLRSILEKKVPGLNRIVLVNNGGEPCSFPIPGEVDYFEIEKSYPAVARNFAIQKCSSDWILFLDDDVIIPDSYFVVADKVIRENHDLDVLGGPDQSYPKSNIVQKALGIAIQLAITTGHTRHRHLVNPVDFLEGTESNLILCHLWVKRIIFTEGYCFPEDYFRNEENIFLERLKKNKKRILHKPELFVFHYRKDSIPSLMRVTFVSAYYRKKSLLKGESNFNLSFFIPSLFVIYLASLGFSMTSVALTPLILYILLSVFMLASVDESMYLKLHVFRIQFLIHLSYGLGFMSPESLIKKIMRC